MMPKLFYRTIAIIMAMLISMFGMRTISFAEIEPQNDTIVQSDTDTADQNDAAVQGDDKTQIGTEPDTQNETADQNDTEVQSDDESQIGTEARNDAEVQNDDESQDEAAAQNGEELQTDKLQAGDEGEEPDEELSDVLEPVTYVDENNNPHTVTEYEVLTGSTSELMLGESGKETWYVLKGDITFNETVFVKGTVNFVLAKDCNVLCEKGIVVEDPDTVCFWGDELESGKIAVETVAGNAAIGSRKDKKCGIINIHSGYIDANSAAVSLFEKSGAGIGSGASYNEQNLSGEINIYGGYVHSHGGSWAAGIGGGYESPSGFIYISGGVVEADAVQYGAGIGSGDRGSKPYEFIYKNPGMVMITGGNVTATGGSDAAGIGGGNGVSGGEIRIKGDAVVVAKGQSQYGGGAGIGGGDEGGAGSILIEGGTITAQGSMYAAGIGTGDGLNTNVDKSGGNVIITGGTITATGGAGGAGIGGGNETDGFWINISGGDITAKGGGDNFLGLGGAGIGGGDSGNGTNIYISGGKVNATGGYKAAGIGGGYGDEDGVGGKGGYIEISGTADVTAKGTDTAAGIGGGFYDSYDDTAIPGGTINIYGGSVKATGGSGGDEGGLTGDIGGAGIGCAQVHEGVKAVAAKINIIEKDGNKIDVTAQGGTGCAGIGGGDNASGADVTINISDQSKVIARGGTYGAGIGSGDEADNSGTLTIENGNVFAYGGKEAAGIGGGNDAELNGSVTINGGNVYAEGAIQGAGIGGGDEGDMSGTIKINGGSVNAQGFGGGAGIGAGYGANQTGKVVINGGTVIANGRGEAAGIGGGEEGLFGDGGEGGPVVINEAATVTAITDASKAMPIGNAEDDGGTAYSLEIYNSASVRAGTAESSATYQTKANRVSSCQNRSNNWVRIEKCQHEDGDAFKPIDMWNHTFTCKYCGAEEIEARHIVENGECVKCHFKGYDVHFLPGHESAGGTMEDVHIDPCTDGYVLPLCDFTLEGQYFAYWQYVMGDKNGNATAGTTIKDIDNDIILTAVWGLSPVYSVVIDSNMKHGTVTPWPTAGRENDQIFVLVEPDDEYELSKLTYTAKNSGNAIEITETITVEGKLYYYFNMPADDVVIGAVFKSPYDVTGVTLEPSSLELGEGSTETLHAEVAPEQAINKDVTWSSSDPTIASVDDNGKVTAVSEGSAVITVTTVEGGFTAECIVNVIHVHNLSLKSEVAPTCEKTGMKEHYECDRCGKLFMDAEGEEVTSREELTISALGHDFGEWVVTKEATETEEGEETRSCSRCDKVETRAIPKVVPIVYHVTQGDGIVWEKGSGKHSVFVFKRSIDDNEAFSHFVGIKIDGKSVDAEYYSAVSGSVVITLKPAFFETLGTGKHTLTALFDDAAGADAHFTITDTSNGKTPKTGDENDIILWMFLLGASVIGLLIAAKKKNMAL